MLIPLQPQPGVFRESTRYAAEGTWYDCDKIRWRKGSPEKIGGWERASTDSFIGVGRKLHDWGTISGSNYLAVGTTYKLYVSEGGAYHDITPVRATVTLGTNPLDTGSAGSPIITVNHTAHGAVVGSFITISGATTWDGIAVGAINTEHRIVAVPDANSYRIVVNDTATAGSVSGGGSAVVVAYQANVGLDTYLAGSGWGSGAWGSGTWGGGVAVSDSNQLRLWSLDNYGDDMISCVRQGGVYYWDESDGTGTRAVKINSLVRQTGTLYPNPIDVTSGSTTFTVNDIDGHGAGVGDTVTLSGASAIGSTPSSEINTSHTITAVLTDSSYQIEVTTDPATTTSGGGSSITTSYQAGVYYTPVEALQVMSSPVARHIIAFGANPIGSPGAGVDPLEIRWCSSEAPAEWEPTPENTAGEQRLSAGSQIIGALRTRQEILIWTDVNLYSMRYVGPPVVFSFAPIYSNVSMISPNAAVSAGGAVYFMDRGGFYVYDGGVRRIPCSVRDYVFGDMDELQAFKVHSGSNVDKSEVVWFYPSSSGNGEIDRYVKFNYDEGLWDFGTLERGAWSEAPTTTTPLATTIRKLSAVDPISVTNTSSTVVVTYPNHKLSIGDQVILQNSVAVGGIDAEILNNLHTLTAVTTNTFSFSVPISGTSTAEGGGTVEIILANHLMAHDIGHDDDGDAMTAYIQSADNDIEDGDRFYFVHRVVPDIEFRGGYDDGSEVQVKFYGRDYPLVNRGLLSSSDVLPDTDQLSVRMRARQLAVRYESSGAGYGWRVGKLRMDARTDGRR